MEGTSASGIGSHTLRRRVHYSVFEYLYRDASNYKAHGELLLLGNASTADIAEIRRHLDMGEYFVAELVGVPPLQGELGVSNDDDHDFHEFVDLRAATHVEVRTLPTWGTLQTLKIRFEASRRGHMRLPSFVGVEN